jgi:hypothetical protein
MLVAGCLLYMCVCAYIYHSFIARKFSGHYSEIFSMGATVHRTIVSNSHMKDSNRNTLESVDFVILLLHFFKLYHMGQSGVLSCHDLKTVTALRDMRFKRNPFEVSSANSLAIF